MGRGTAVFISHLAAACCLLFPGPLSAQTPLYFDEIGCGPRPIALGQAFTAVADDASAAYYNPAGLCQLPSVFLFSAGYQYVRPDIYIDVRDKSGAPYVTPPHLDQKPISRTRDISTRALWIGYGVNFGRMAGPKGRVNPLRNLALGFVMSYSLPNVATFWNPQTKQSPYHLRYNYGFCLMSMAVSFSYRITESLSVGAGILPRIDTFSDTTKSYLELDKLINPVGGDGGFRLNLKTTARASAAWVAGILFRPSFSPVKGKLSLGASYRSEVDGFYGTGNSTDDIVVIDPITGDKVRFFPINAFTVDYIGYNPAQATAGLAVKPLPGMTVSADLTWKDYSKFKFFWHLPPEPRFRDTWIPRVGLEYFFFPEFHQRLLRRVSRILLMGGYSYEPTPVPDMNGVMNVLDSDKHVISFGLGLDCHVRGLDLLKVEAYFQTHLMEEEVLHNRQDPLFGRITSGGEVYSMGISVSIQL